MMGVIKDHPAYLLTAVVKLADRVSKNLVTDLGTKPRMHVNLVICMLANTWVTPSPLK